MVVLTMGAAKPVRGVHHLGVRKQHLPRNEGRSSAPGTLGPVTTPAPSQHLLRHGMCVSSPYGWMGGYAASFSLSSCFRSHRGMDTVNTSSPCPGQVSVSMHLA